MKKTLSVLLSLIMLLAMFAACADGKPSDTTTEANPTVTTAPTGDVTTSEPAITISVEDLSTNGTPLKFNMLVRTNRYAYLYCEEANGNIEDYAVFKRNTMIEDAYGIKFSISQQNDANGYTTALKAATDEYDIVVADYWWNLDLLGLFVDINQMPEINLSDGWWTDGWNKIVTMNNRLYTVAGDASLETLENLEVMFFNKNMAKDLNLDLYKTVSDEKWTVDNCIEVIKTAASGLDDNDTTNDVYGAMYDLHSVDAQLYSCGMKLSESVDGEINVDIANSESVVNIVEAVGKLIHTPGTDYNGATARARDWSLFKNNSALIYATSLYIGKSLKSGNLDFDYGIIPMPKMTEEDKYVSTSYGVSVFGIPVTVASAHNSALILNAMNFHSANTDDSIVTTFYEVVLKYQVASSPEDVDNLELVRKNVYFDFAFVYPDTGLDTAVKNCAISNTSAATALKAAVKTAKLKISNTILPVYTK